MATIGEDQRARDWIDRALLLDPDNGPMRYNLACALTVGLKDFDRALDVLGPFFERVASTTHIRHLEADPDFNPLRDDPQFKQMLSDAKERLGLGG